MSAQTLHVTNGDAVLYVWKKAGLLGTHLAWRDALHDGPVPGDLPLEELSRVRARFLSQAGYGSPIKINYDFERRDATIRRARDFDEVVLWFEHDLYDQLQLLQVLNVLNEMRLGVGAVQLIASEQYLGMLTAEELMALYPKRRSITPTIMEGAQRAWGAFTAATPSDLPRASRERYVGLKALPEALRRLCEDFPALDTGLARTEKQLALAAQEGARRKDDLFRKSQAREEAAFLSDTACAAVIARLCRDPAPLLTEHEEGYDITLLGRRVLAGDADWVEHQPLDRFIGGTHLTTQRHWRWDEAAGDLREIAADNAR